MKKLSLVLCLVCMILLTVSGCNKTNEGQTGIEKAVADFYQADYDYERISETYDIETNTYSKVIFEGQVFHSPYREHIKVVSSENETVWNEIYYDKKLFLGRAHISTDDGWVLQFVSQNHPSGYGEKLQFQLDRVEMIDGRNVEVYTAEYTNEISKLFLIQEDLTYIIKQEYYLDQDRQSLIRVVTDLTDSYKLGAIANYMSANGSTLEEAEKNVKEYTTSQHKEILNIFNYGNPTEIKWPEFNK